ncbi:regulatory protein GemA [Roseobacter sp. TSBP12]|uniref:gp16 family protein n=1 Tax=Roseobacter sp. TSBP12 TaxID=1236613 RepID=UPI00125F3BEB|nr:regulatory protein GemA [Roseobacter sp. TSBP12]KAB6715840.1 regulatory protein GemA [Roseobacter sp. TSBP12]
MTDRTLQRQIFAGCKQLGIDDDTRHDLQLVVTGKASLSDMSDAELRAVVENLKERGFKAGFNGGKKGKFKPAPRADLRLIHVLWKLLGDAGVLDRPDRAGLNAFVRSRFEGKWQSVPIDIDALRDADQINAVIRALKDMCRRNGVQTK